MQAPRFKPRPYQQLLIDHIIETPRCAGFVFMGGGKTAGTLSAIITLDLLEEVLPVLIVAPLRVARKTWLAETQKWADFQHLTVSTIIGTAAERTAAIERKADIYTINPENLPWLLERVPKNKFRMIVVDECFVGETLISTPEGEKRIDSLKVGDTVTTLLGPKKVTNVFKKQTTELVRVRLTCGRELLCTPTHRIWTEDGWRAAKDVTGLSTLRVADMQNVRPEVWRACVTGQQQEADRSWGATRHLLQSWLQIEGHHGAGPGKTPGERQETFGALDQGEPFLEPRETALRGDPSEAVRSLEREIDRGIAPAQRRKRSGDVALRGASCQSSECGLGVELNSADQAPSGHRMAGPSESLQAGFHEPENDDLHRGRWEFSQDSSWESQGCEEASGLGSSRVVRVESVECGSRVDVWDIEVEDAHHFFAEGILVHNCSKVKNFRGSVQEHHKTGKKFLRCDSGKQAKALAHFAWNCERIVLLTGTPAARSLENLWAQLWFIDFGERLYRTFEQFSLRWFRPHPSGYGLEATTVAQDEIQQRIKDVCLTIEAKDWFDLKAPIRTIVEVELPPQAMRAYRDMERSMLLEIDGHEVEAMNAASKTMRCLQLASGAIYTDEDRNWSWTHDEKIEALRSVINEANGMPVLVAYQWQSDLQRLLEAFPEGRHLKTLKDEDDFKAGKIPVLFAHPQSAGHGIDGFQYVTNIIAFFGHWWDLETRLQIIERIGPVRQLQAGLDRPVFIYDIVAKDTIDELVMQRHETKREVQELLLEALARRKETA